MVKPIHLRKATAFSIGELDQPIITKYQLGIIFFQLCISQKYDNQVIAMPKNAPSLQAFKKIQNELFDAGVIDSFQDFENVFSITGKKADMEEEVACTIDPFAFISHLSAMAYHGLTDRMPKVIFLSTPAQSDWKKYAAEKMEKDLKEHLNLYNKQKLPQLTRIHFDKVIKKSIHKHSSIHLGAYKSVKNKNLRVSTIGRTFLDMLKKPDNCGGIYHVIDVYKENAASYLKIIINEIDRHGSAIDKVRAGFILEDLCGISNSEIDEWKKYAARGGSRKLNPAEDYSSNFSEKWCLSINVELDEF